MRERSKPVSLLL
jgi:p70 ribosomal S6 kinase